jgi:hypothetical protein
MLRLSSKIKFNKGFKMNFMEINAPSENLEIKSLPNGEILETNFFETARANQGMFFLSFSSGVFRLLLPPKCSFIFDDIKTAKDIIITRGNINETTIGNILFDDLSHNPLVFFLHRSHIDFFVDTDIDKTYELKIIIYNEKLEKLLEDKCYFRHKKDSKCLDAIDHTNILSPEEHNKKFK